MIRVLQTSTVVKTTMAEPANIDTNPGYETTDARITPLAQVGIFMAILVAVSFVSMIVLFKVFAYYQPIFDDPVPVLASARIVTDEPRLQVDPPAQKIAMDRNVKEILTSYGWIDEKVKVARIPIERAIVLVSQSKIELPTRGQTVQ